MNPRHLLLLALPLVACQRPDPGPPQEFIELCRSYRALLIEEIASFDPSRRLAGATGNRLEWMLYWECLVQLGPPITSQELLDHLDGNSRHWIRQFHAEDPEERLKALKATRALLDEVVRDR